MDDLIVIFFLGKVQKITALPNLIPSKTLKSDD